MIKKFSDFIIESATSEWEEALYNSAKEYLYGGEEPSIFNEIMDSTFGPEFKGEKPSKEEMIAKFIEWTTDALNNYVFTEDESDGLQDDSDAGVEERIQENIENDALKNNKNANNLFHKITNAGLGYCMDIEEDKANFLKWLEANYNIEKIRITSDLTADLNGVKYIIGKNTSWCTDNEGDMRALLSVIFDEDLMGEYAEDYEPFDELKAQYF